MNRISTIPQLLLLDEAALFGSAGPRTPLIITQGQGVLPPTHQCKHKSHATRWRQPHPTPSADSSSLWCHHLPHVYTQLSPLHSSSHHTSDGMDVYTASDGAFVQVPHALSDYDS